MKLTEVPFENRSFTPDPEPAPSVGWGDTWQSAWELETPIEAGWSLLGDTMPQATDEDRIKKESGTFDSLLYVADKYPDYDEPSLQPLFIDLESESQVDWKAKKIQDELHALDVQMEAPWWKVLPTTMIAGWLGSPFTPAEIALSLATRNPAGAVGGGVLKTITSTRGMKRTMQFAGISMPMTAVEEYMLSQDQEFRTLGQSAVVTATSGLMTGGLGYLTGRAKISQINENLVSNVSAVQARELSGDSASAARTLVDISQSDFNKIIDDPNLTPEQKTIRIANKQGENYELSGNLFGKLPIKAGNLLRLNPEAYFATSRYPMIRRMGAIFTNQPYLYKGMEKGEWHVNLDATARRWDTHFQHVINSVAKKGYRAYKEEGGRLSYDDFSWEVQKTVASKQKHASKAVNDTGNDLFENIVKPIGLDSVRAKLNKARSDGSGLPARPLGDEEWWPRMFSREYARRQDHVSYATPMYEARLRRLASQADEEKVQIEKKIATLEKQWKAEKAPVTPELKALRAKAKKSIRDKAPKKRELKALQSDKGAKKFFDHWKKTQRSMANDKDSLATGEYSRYGLRFDEYGQMKTTESRTFDAATIDMPREYFNANAFQALNNHVSRMKRQMLVHEDARIPAGVDEKMPDDVTFNYWKTELDNYHFAELKDVDPASRKAKKMVREYERAKQYINKLAQDYYQVRPTSAFDSISGFMQGFKAWQAMAKLGSVLFTTIPELGAGLSHNGVRGYVRHVTGWIADPKAMAKLTRDEWALYDIGVQGQIGAMRWAEMGDYEPGHGKIYEAVHWAADRSVDKVFMLGKWTRMLSAQMAAMSQSKLGRIMLKANMSKTDMNDLGRLGIPKTMWKAVSDEVHKHGIKIKGGNVDLNVGKWDNKEIADVVINAINAEADNIIIRPGTGAVPFVGKRLEGSVLYQFKQFLMASTSKYMMADLQRAFNGDLRAIERQLAFLALGTLSMHAKNNYLYGDRAKQRWDSMDWDERIKDGLLAGGGTGIAGDMVGVMNEIMFPGSSTRYYGQRSWRGMLTGPSVGSVLEEGPAVIGLIGSMLSDEQEITPDQVKSIFKFAPYNSFWPLRMANPSIREDTYDFIREKTQ